MKLPVDTIYYLVSVMSLSAILTRFKTDLVECPSLD